MNRDLVRPRVLVSLAAGVLVAVIAGLRLAERVIR